MFENVKTITDLNRERAQLYAQPNANIIEINNAYNTIRSKLSSVETTGGFKKMKFFTCTPDEQETHNKLPYLGQNNSANIIVITDEGVFC